MRLSVELMEIVRGPDLTKQVPLYAFYGLGE